MGLDMYLNANRYVSNFFNKGDSERAAAIQQHFPELEVLTPRWGKESPIKEITVEAGYWRKANQIHNWFVKNVQGGEDNCETYDVTRDQLAELRDLCQEVLDNRERAMELLPPAAGFFFGSTEVNDYYFGDLENTIRQIDAALKLPESWDFVYRSSW